MSIRAPRTSRQVVEMIRCGVLVFLVGCKAALSPAAGCRERKAHPYDPGAVAIADRNRFIVRTIRCDGAFGDAAARCSDDAPTAIRFEVTTGQGPPSCSTWDMRGDCWWANEPGSSHGDSPGEIDAAGTYTLSSIADAAGGATEIIAHVGVARASTRVGVGLVLVENPGHVPSDVVDGLSGAAEAPASLRLEGPHDGSVWRTAQGDGEPVRVPTIDIQGRITAARVHIETTSRSIAYDGYFAGSPVALSRATWSAISRSTEQNESLVVRVHAVSGGVVTVSSEQRWRVDHGIFYHSPESLAQGRDEDARSKRERAAFEQEWIRTHSYIPRDEAIARAVRFLEDQGFTNAPAAGPLRRDIVEAQPEVEVRASRRGSIDPSPVGTLKKAGWWWIAFRGVHADPCSVRVVAIAADGARQRMIHQSLSLSTFE